MMLFTPLAFVAPWINDIAALTANAAFLQSLATSLILAAITDYAALIRTHSGSLHLDQISALTAILHQATFQELRYIIDKQ